MSEQPSPNERARRRWISIGELIALAALVVSAAGLWLAWNSSSQDKPTRVVEQRQPIPLVLRGHAEDDGRTLVLAPVEESHALESLSVTIAGGKPIDVASDGKLDAGDVEASLDDKDRKGNGTVRARIVTRYVEMGTERRASGAYMLRYRWESGGLFGGRSLRLTAITRA